MEIEAVTAILREAAEIAVQPRFRALAEGDVSEKSPGQAVTIADSEAEELISARLRALIDAPVVGEEATAADPSLLRAVRGAPVAWVVDPVDGTNNFIAGRPEYAVMTALVRGGRTVAAWILQPAYDRAYVAELGSGAWRDGTPLRRAPAPADPSLLRGAARTRYLEPEARSRVRAAAGQFASFGRGSSCAGFDYADLAEGRLDFALFWRTLPWDHAPGTLLLTEAGGCAKHPDGTDWVPGGDRPGLLNAADEGCWALVRSLLLGTPGG